MIGERPELTFRVKIKIVVVPVTIGAEPFINVPIAPDLIIRNDLADHLQYKGTAPEWLSRHNAFAVAYLFYQQRFFLSHSIQCLANLIVPAALNVVTNYPPRLPLRATLLSTSCTAAVSCLSKPAAIAMS